MLADGDPSTPTAGSRRRSTFYVPLVEKTPGSNGVSPAGSPQHLQLNDSQYPAKQSPAKKVSRSPSVKKEETPKKLVARVTERPRPVLRRASPSKSPLKSPRLTIKEATPPPMASPTARIRSPLLKVSAKLLSSSAQALEAISKSPTSSPTKPPCQRSPLSLIRRASSRKLTRSSSTILSRAGSTNNKDDSATPSPVNSVKIIRQQSSATPSPRSQPADTKLEQSDSVPRNQQVPIIVIEQLPDRHILSSAANKAQQRRHVKLDEDDAVHSGKFSNVVFDIPDLKIMGFTETLSRESFFR